MQEGDACHAEKPKALATIIESLCKQVTAQDDIQQTQQQEVVGILHGAPESFSDWINVLFVCGQIFVKGMGGNQGMCIWSIKDSTVRSSMRPKEVDS